MSRYTTDVHAVVGSLRRGAPRSQIALETGVHAAPEHWFESEPLWFKTAVFYEVYVRGFFDGNGDGMGDFRGLIEKLDYLQWLGVDCVWLLPMYPSPLKDGGYDIAAFDGIHPDYGNLAELERFIGENGLPVLQAIALRRDKNVRQEAVLKIPKEAIHDRWDATVDGMESAIRFLVEGCGVIVLVKYVPVAFPA